MIFEKKIVGIYKSQFLSRCDDKGLAHYFSHADFPGLRQQPFDFRSSLGHTMKGWFYCYDEIIPGQLVVFDHGFGGGHQSYMKEIEMLARRGYLVYTYDHTGCMTSGGEHTNGFAQSLSDLDCCLRTLRAEPALADRKFAVMGHSWGGFSTMNICALHPEITHVVSMSGFVSVELMLQQIMAGPLKAFRKPLMALEMRSNPEYVHFDARKSLADTKAKVLLIYSEDDKTVGRTPHYDSLYAALSGQENIRFLLVNHKDHNPAYTTDAVAYKNAFFKEFSKAVKKNQLETPQQQKEFMCRYDWHRMTAQDEAVWQQIIDHLKAE